MKKYILFEGGNGYAGCEYSEALVFDENEITDEDLNEISNDMMRDNAESFEYIHFGWDEKYSEEDELNYYENYAYGTWSKISREEYEEWCANWSIVPEEE